MHPCDDCDFEARSARGLVLHRRAKHPADAGDANRRAMERTLAELDRNGWLEEIDAARVQALRSLAAAVDHNPHSAQLWREYREALNEVLEADDDADVGLTDALGQIRRAAALGDSPPS